MSQLSVICHINKYTLRCTLSTGVLNVRPQHSEVNFKTQDWLDWGVGGLGGGRSGQVLVAPGEDTGSRRWGQGSFGLLGGGLAEANFLGCFHIRLGNQKSHLLASMSDQIYCPEIKERGEDDTEEPAAAWSLPPPSPPPPPSPGCRTGLLVSPTPLWSCGAGQAWHIPHIADIHQAAAVHFQDSVPQ